MSNLKEVGKITDIKITDIYFYIMNKKLQFTF